MFKRSCIVTLAPVNIGVRASPLPSFSLLSFRSTTATNWEARHTLNIILHVAGKPCPLKKALRGFKWTRRSHVESYGSRYSLAGREILWNSPAFTTLHDNISTCINVWSHMLGDHSYALAEFFVLQSATQPASIWACTLNTVQGRGGKMLLSTISPSFATSHNHGGMWVT